MDRANIWSTQHLVEFVAAVGSFTDEDSAVHRGLELAGEALEAELAFVIRDGAPIASIGVPAGHEPEQCLIGAILDGSTTIDVPRLGPCQALHVPLDDTGSGRIVLIRQGDDPFTRTEVSLAGGMARVLTLSLRTLRLLEAERALREQSERQAREALHDSLTGLPNRGLFLERLDEALQDVQPGRAAALLFLDMDGFKVVNDSLGHQAGDRLLVAVAERLACCVPRGAAMSRLGGDEFAVLLDVGDADEAVAVAECILAAMERSFSLQGHEMFVTASIGIAVEACALPQELLRSADVAMYKAKGDGPGRYTVFERSMHDDMMRRLELQADLRRAIGGDELVLHFQPIVTLQTGQVCAVEALVRWQHPTVGMIPPLDFIRLAEETGLIVPLGAWVLEDAMRQLVELEARQPSVADRGIRLNVNVSARQFKQPDFVDFVADAARGAGVDPSRLVLEITETVLLERTAQTSANLAGLRELGALLAVDDFGTGYSSLGYLHRMPVDLLKIDKSFVDGIPLGGSSVVRAVVNLGHSLGLSSTAEGVETIEQYELLRAVGCDRAQGYLMSKPLPFEELVEFLDTADERARAGWAPSTTSTAAA
jgi:diguanylate cyclase (GGDEF)-like protein